MKWVKKINDYREDYIPLLTYKFVKPFPKSVSFKISATVSKNINYD